MANIATLLTNRRQNHLRSNLNIQVGINRKEPYMKLGINAAITNNQSFSDLSLIEKIANGMQSKIFMIMS